MDNSTQSGYRKKKTEGTEDRWETLDPIKKLNLLPQGNQPTVKDQFNKFRKPVGR